MRRRRGLRVLAESAGTALSLPHHLRPIDPRPIEVRAEEWLSEAEEYAERGEQ